VEWESLEATTPGCVIERGSVVLPAEAREVKFSGVTDPRSHPIPASESCVVVDIKRIVPAREVQS
jgi:hypothetical protein